MDWEISCEEMYNEYGEMLIKNISPDTEYIDWEDVVC